MQIAQDKAEAISFCYQLLIQFTENSIFVRLPTGRDHHVVGFVAEGLSCIYKSIQHQKVRT